MQSNDPPMDNQEIRGEDYVVYYDAKAIIVKFQGELALRSPKEYAPINELLHNAVNADLGVITIDLRKLTFLNSSGISMLSKVVLGLRKRKDLQLTILGSANIPWQGKSLKNLQKFLPSLVLTIE